MLRKLLAAGGVAEILFPERVVDASERFTAANPDAPERKSWVVPSARAEGVFFLFLAWRSDATYSLFKRLLAVVGVVVTLFPRQFVDTMASVAYENPDEIEWEPWTDTLARVVGPVLVLVGAREWQRKR